MEETNQNVCKEDLIRLITEIKNEKVILYVTQIVKELKEQGAI